MIRNASIEEAGLKLIMIAAVFLFTVASLDLEVRSPKEALENFELDAGPVCGLMPHNTAHGLITHAAAGFQTARWQVNLSL